MSIKQFHQELSKGMPSSVYLFYSSEDFLLYDILMQIKESFSENAFNFDLFDLNSPDDNKPIEHIIDILNTLPFLSDRRVVIIQNIQKISKRDSKKLEHYLKNPSKSSLFIMLYEGKPPKLFEGLSAKNIKVIGVNIYEKDIPMWLNEKAKKKGIKFTDEALEYLINYVGNDLGMLYMEIEKFSSLNKDIVNVDDIREIVYSGINYSAFDLVNALQKRDAKEVFRIYEKLSKNTEPQILLGALNYQYTAMSSKTNENKRGYKKIFQLLHEADVAIKRSHNFVMEELLLNLLAHTK